VIPGVSGEAGKEIGHLAARDEASVFPLCRRGQSQNTFGKTIFAHGMFPALA